LPYQVTFNNGNSIEWLYLTDGTKVQKTAQRKGKTTPILQQDYIGNVEYRNDTLEAVYMEDGRLTFDNGMFKRFEYYLSDHLGNNRVLFSDDGSGNATILQNQDFYPFGLQIAGDYVQNTSTEDKYRFNGKEYNDDFGLNLTDFGNRWHDPTIGRFTTIDRFAEKYASMSPFGFGANNPIKYIDVNGDSITVTSGKRTLVYENGNFYEKGQLVSRNKRGKITGGGSSFFRTIEKMFSTLNSTNLGQKLINALPLVSARNLNFANK
jgi:RHS repeat-associated protein